MKILMLLAVIAALVAPVAAFAGTTPNPASTANQLCKASQTLMGTQLFATTYGGTNAFGKCVSKNSVKAQAIVASAEKTCKAQQADATFAANHGNKTFDQFYGSTSKGKSADANAYGKCVSRAVSNSVAAHVKVTVAAAKTCKAALKANAADFATKYGKTSSAFGKCVAATSAAK